jgi:uncharacterized protein (TIGR02453 family)
MTPGFTGFPSEGMAFFRALARNNRREWFQPRKTVYDEQVKAPMTALVTAINEALIGFAPAHVNEPEHAIFRVYRDTRFSPDKTPYKTHTAAVFPRRGFGKLACASFYFSVSPKEIEVAGGIYMPTPNELRPIRQHLAENYEEFRRIVAARALRTLVGELRGDQLSRTPKGFDPAHPAADLVRYKQWLFWIMLDPALASTPKLLPELVKRFRAMAEFVEFLNEPLVAERKRSSRKEIFAP